MTGATDDTDGLWRATGLTQPPQAPTYPFDPPQPVADDARCEQERVEARGLFLLLGVGLVARVVAD